MKFSLLSLTFFLVTLTATVPVLAEEEIYRFEDIIVTASRTESLLKEAPANVSVITSEEIASTGAQTVVDAIRREPGVFAQSYLGNPKAANIDIRGYGEATPQNVLVLVNGRRVNGIDLTGADLAQAPVDAIERIELYRGPGTVLYGDNATGGVINIILKAGKGPPKVIASATGGSYNYFKPELLFTGKQGRFSYLATVSEVETQGYRHNNEFYGKDALGNFRVNALTNLAFNLSAGHHRDSYGQPGALFWSNLRSGIVDPKDSTKSYLCGKASTEDNFIDLEPEVKIGDSVLVSLGASYRNRHISSSFDYGFGAHIATKGQMETYAFTPKAAVSHTLSETMKNSLIFGIDWYRYPTSAKSDSFFGSPSLTKNDVEKRDFAYYATDRFYPMAGLMFEAGYRKQRSSYDIKNADLLNGITEGDMSSRYDREAFRFSGIYSIRDRATIFASYSKGFRFPATDEFISWGYYDSWTNTFVPTQVNTSLKPQTTEEFDIGIRWNPWRGLSGTVAYFHTNNRDEIYYNPMTYSNQNYDKTRRQGVEASLFFNPAPGLLLNFAYSYTEARFDGGSFGGNRIPLAPENKFSAKVEYSINGWDLNIASVYTGDRYAISDLENAREKLPGYTTFDAAIRYRFSSLSVLFLVKNFTDKKYNEIGAYSAFRNDIGLYPAPGRQFFLTVKYVLGG